MSIDTTLEHKRRHLYNRLEALAVLAGSDSLRAFMEESMEANWRENEPYEPFNFTTLADHVLVGYRALINGDSCPDPGFKIKVEHEAQRAEVISWECFPFNLIWVNQQSLDEQVDQTDNAADVISRAILNALKDQPVDLHRY